MRRALECPREYSNSPTRKWPSHECLWARPPCSEMGIIGTQDESVPKLFSPQLPIIPQAATMSTEGPLNCMPTLPKKVQAQNYILLKGLNYSSISRSLLELALINSRALLSFPILHIYFMSWNSCVIFLGGILAAGIKLFVGLLLPEGISTRLGRVILLQIPFFKCYHFVRSRKCSFSIAAPVLWSTLPKDLADSHDFTLS